MGIFEEMASGAEVVGADKCMDDPMERVKRCSYIVLRADRQEVRKLGNDKLKRFLAVEAACRSVGLGQNKPHILDVHDWKWMEQLFEDSEAARLDPGPEAIEQMRKRAESVEPDKTVSCPEYEEYPVK